MHAFFFKCQCVFGWLVRTDMQPWARHVNTRKNIGVVPFIAVINQGRDQFIILDLHEQETNSYSVNGGNSARYESFVFKDC
jgi:hypothetical protein